MLFISHSVLTDKELKQRKYAFPDERKFPMPDKKHVLSAIKFFNYISPDKEKILAKEILKRIKEYGMTNINVGPDNRFLKYYKRGKDMSQTTLIHSAKGQTWGKHKYIAIKNGRYIYPEEDVTKNPNFGKYKPLHGESLYTIIQPNNRKKSYVERLMDSSKSAKDRIEKRKLDLDRDPEYRKAEKEIFKKDGHDYESYYNEYVKPHLKELNDADKKDNKIIERNKNRAGKYAKATMTAPENKIVRKADVDKQRNEDIRKKTTTHRNGMESGNSPYSEDNKIYRKSDVDENKIKLYAMKNSFTKAVKKFGNKGKAFLLSLFGK